MRPSLFLLLAFSVLVNPSRISAEGALMEVGLDWQVMLKLGISAITAALGAWGLLTLPSIRRSLLSVPSMIVAAILLIGLPAALRGYSDSALPSIVINLSYLVFAAGCIVYLRIEGFLFAILLGSLMTCFFAWLIYFLLPDYGVFEENVGSVTISRLSGLSHPNSVGRTCAFGILSLVALYRAKRLTQVFVCVLAGVLLVTLFFTLSRTAMLACMIGIGFLYFDKVRTPAGIQILSLGALVGVLFVFTLIISGNEQFLADKIVGSLAKTGEASELTSGTGRAEIWTESIRLIRENPYTGYGIGAAQELLIDFYQSTHNMFLHTTMVSGIFGGALLILLTIHLVRIGFVGQYRAVSALAMCLLVSGLLEDTVFETFPAVGTMVFFFCLLHPAFLPAGQFRAKDEVILSHDELVK